MKLKRFIIFYLSVIILLLITNGCHRHGDDNGDEPVISQADISIGTIDPLTHPGDFDVIININNAANVTGIYFRLNFDPKLIQLQDKNNPANNVTEGTFFNQGGVTTHLLVNFLDKNPDSGCLLIGLSRQGGSTAINGNGEMLRLKFKTISQGSATINFSLTAGENSLFGTEIENIAVSTWAGREIIIQ